MDAVSGSFISFLKSKTDKRMFAEISEAKVLAAAASFSSLGLKDAGYEYLNVDVSLQLLEEETKSDSNLGLLVSYGTRFSHRSYCT